MDSSTQHYILRDFAVTTPHAYTVVTPFRCSVSAVNSGMWDTCASTGVCPAASERYHLQCPLPVGPLVPRSIPQAECSVDCME
eukprot:bmy_01981T0